MSFSTSTNLTPIEMQDDGLEKFNLRITHVQLMK